MHSSGNADKPHVAGYLEGAVAVLSGNELRLTFRSKFSKSGIDRQLDYIKKQVAAAAGKSYDIILAVDETLPPLRDVPCPGPRPRSWSGEKI